MSNKKVLSQATRGLNKTKAPSKPRDIIYDPMGYWNPNNQGQPVRIPGNGKGTNITMGPNPETGTPIPYPVWAQPNVGQPQMMYPGQDYNFPEADYVDEYPQMKRGGLKKNKTSRSLMATNKLFAKHAFFKKPRKNVIFDPNSPNYQDGGFIIELDDDEIQAYKDGGYVVEDISVPEINQYAKGGGKKKKKETAKEQEPGIVSKTPFQPGTYDPNEMAGSMVNLSEATKSEKAPMWVEFANEYEKKNSRQAFIDGKKRDYLKQNKGLNTAAGVNMDNFPEKVAQNFANEYDYKKNNYVTKRLGKEKDFNPRNRGEWVDELSPGERKAVENSRYGSKLQASAWDRSLAGLKKIGSYASSDIGKMNIEGLTKAEQEEIQNSKLGALETFAPMDIPGMAIANFAKNRGLSTGSNYKQLPGGLSGNKMANVSDMEAMVLNPLTYAGLEALPELGVNAARAAYKGAKTIPKIAKEVKLSNAYKINPYALKENPEMYVYRARPVGQNPDMNMAATLRAKEAAGEPLNWMQKNIIKMSEGTVPDMGGVAAREKYYGRWFDSDPKNLDYYINPDTRNFADNDAIEILRSKLPRAEADKLKVSQFEDAKSLSGFPERELILPKDKINAAEKFPESSWQQLIQEDEAFNKPHWLKGFGSKTDNSGLTQAGLGSGLFDFISGAKNINKNTKAVSKIDDDLLEAYNLAADLKRQGKISKLPETPEAFDNWLQSQYNQRPIYRVVDVNQDVVNNPVIKNNMIKQGLDPNNEYHVAEYMGTSVAPAEVINRGRRSGGHDELLKGSNKDILYFAEDPSWLGPRYGGNNPYYVKTFADELPTGYKNQVLGLRSNSRMKKNYSRNYPGFDINQVPSGVIFEDKVLSVGPNTITPIIGDKGAKVRKIANIVKGSDFDRLPNKRFNKGGYVDAELTPKEIEWYKSQGYTIEEL